PGTGRPIARVSNNKPNRLGVPAPVVAVAQDPTGQRPGMPAVLQQNLTVDDGHVDALGRLLDAPGAGREVVYDLERQRAHRVGIEDDDVGRHPGTQQAAIVEPEYRGRIESQPAHRLL